MSQDRVTSPVLAPVLPSSAEVEDWLAMELEEERGCRVAAVGWCVSHARSILSTASILVWSLVITALIFG